MTRPPDRETSAASPSALAAAFDAALRQVDRVRSSDLRTAAGEPMAPFLTRLHDDLRAERDAALARGGADPAWVRRTVRWVADWTPEGELALLAALGRIARGG